VIRFTDEARRWDLMDSRHKKLDNDW